MLVQAFTLLSNLTQKRNRLNAGSVYLGMTSMKPKSRVDMMSGIAVRMAIGLGLHRELPLWRITPFERETRFERIVCASNVLTDHQAPCVVGAIHVRLGRLRHFRAASGE